MQRILALTTLTWKAAFRYRLFWVLTALLLGAVVLLPLLIKDDGTARGFTQIVLTYTLSTVTALLGLSTLWLACGTLARDIEDAQMQMVAVKPIARWQIWFGKWLGLVSLNAVLLALAGAAIYGLLLQRAGRLEPAQQRILRAEVLVSRGSLRQPMPNLEAETDRVLAERLKQSDGAPLNERVLREHLRAQVQASYEVLPRGKGRRYDIELGARRLWLRDVPLFVRLKFNAAATNELATYRLLIEAGPPESAQRVSGERSFSDNTFHEFSIPPNLFDANGRLTVDIFNRSQTALLVPLKDGFEVLYREGGFALNFARGLGIILCWLALLASLGLAAASFLSFPVAAFCSASVLILSLSTGVLAGAVEGGSVFGANEETGEINHSPLDWVLLPLFKALITVFGTVQNFSPVDALSTGRAVGWATLGLAFVKIVVVLGGLLAALGVFTFNRRELATAQSRI